MLITTGREKSDGTFLTRVVGESKGNETVKEAITRIAELFLAKPLSKKKHRWVEKWGRLGKHESPTEHLPGLFVEERRGDRLFEVATRWDNGEWVLFAGPEA